ncbi:MAG: putative Ig domain-containing protein, partial [Bacteroidales bacterium]
MKKFKPVLLLFFFCFSLLNNSKADIVFTSTPDTTAFVGELYSYQVTVAYDGTAPTFSLVEKPTGMSIGASSGLITWSPGSITQGGRIVVKATNSTTPEKFHTYFIYLSDAIECPSKIISYWKLDETEGPVYKDYISGYDAYHGGSEMILYDTAGVVDYGQRFKPLSEEDQFLVVNNVEDFNWSEEDTFAISLWFKWDGTKHPNQNMMFVGRSDGNKSIVFGIRYISPVTGLPIEPRVIFYMNDGNGHERDVHVTGLNNNWHHVVAEFIGAPNGQVQTLNLYYDKVNHGGDQQWFDSFEMDTTNKLYLGYWNALGVSDRAPFSGAMDEIAIYNKVLGTAGVTKIYNDGIARKPQCQPGNYAPVITSSPAKSVNEDTPYSYTLTFRDIDGDAITKSAKILPKWLTFNTSSGVLSGIPLNNNVGDTVVSLAIN